MKNVELIRARVIRGVHGELIRLRSFISSLGGNEGEVELLHGDSGLAIVAVVADTVMRELGHTTALEPDHPDSQIRDGLRTRRRVK